MLLVFQLRAGAGVVGSLAHFLFSAQVLSAQDDGNLY